MSTIVPGGASAGSTGWRPAGRSAVDCLLLDYDLPDLDGLQFLAELTGGTDQAPVPVVMLTGRGGESIAVEALKRGAQDYLVKGSFTPEVLRKTVDDAIERVADPPRARAPAAASWSGSTRRPARPTAARTSSWPCSPTSCATRWPRSSTPSRS